MVTRSPGQSGELIDAITEAGGGAVALPMIETRVLPDAAEVLRALLDGCGKDDWLAVLSPNGARYVIEIVGEQPACRIAVVGPATEQVFVDCGWTVAMRPDEPTAAGLAVVLPSSGRAVVAQASIGRRELRDDLRAKGWDVDIVSLYETIRPKIVPSAVEKARAADVVVLTSPSAVRHYADVVGTHQLAVCIGPTTEDEATSAGFETVTAVGPTVDALLTQLLRIR